METNQKYCKNCNELVAAHRKSTNHLFHLIASVVTCGFWLIVWGLSCIKFGGWRCSKCGGRV